MMAACSSPPGVAMTALKSDQQDQTYNIHHGQDVVLDVFASVVAHHHLVGHHERLHEALAADRAPPPPPPAASVRRLAAVPLRLGGRVERRRRRRERARRRRAELARWAASDEVCGQRWSSGSAGRLQVGDLPFEPCSLEAWALWPRSSRKKNKMATDGAS